MSLFESAVCDNSPFEGWQVLPVETGSEGIYRGGVAGSPCCVYQNVPGHALRWDNMTSGDTTVGCDSARIEKESCI